jgi:ApaG protein
MRGEYTMILHDGDRPIDPTEQLAFDVEIPAFTLHTPNSLN